MISNETAEIVKQKIVDILSKYKLDLAHLSAFSSGNANVNFGKFHLAYKLFNKENERILPIQCLADLVYSTA